MEERELLHLGKWLPSKESFKAHFRSFGYAFSLTLIMLLETTFLSFEIKGGAWYSFYIGAFLKYSFRATVVLLFALVIEKRPLGSLGLRNFKMKHGLNKRELLWTVILCLLFLPGIPLMPVQSFYQSMDTKRLLIQAVYVLLAVSLVEEIIWRGFIFSRLSLSVGKILALFLTSSLNAIWHLPYYLRFLPTQGISILPSLVVAFVIAIVMCLLVVLSEKLIGRWNIYPAVFLHWLGDVGAFIANRIF